MVNYLDGLTTRKPTVLSTALRYRNHGDKFGRPWGEWDASETLTLEAVLHVYDHYTSYLKANDEHKNTEFLANNPEFSDYLGYIRTWQKTSSKS